MLSRDLESKPGSPDPQTGEFEGGVARHHALAQRVVALLEWWSERINSANLTYYRTQVGNPNPRLRGVPIWPFKA